MVRGAVTSFFSFAFALPCGAGGESIIVRERARDFGKGTSALSIRLFRKRAFSSSLVFDGMEFLLLRIFQRMSLQNKRQTKGA